MTQKKNFLLQLIFIFLLPMVLQVNAQTVVEGFVYDSESSEPIEYASVLISGTQRGVITDSNGKFSIEVNPGDSFFEISFVGYTAAKVEINVNTIMKIFLEEDASILDEVVLVADKSKINPAHNILRRIRANHEKYSLKQGKTFELRKYDKVRFDIYDPDSTLKHLGPFKGFEELKSRKYRKGDLYFVPFLLIEEINKVYGKNNPTRTREVLEASNASGANNNQSLTTYMRELYLNYDVFDNSIVLFNKKFVSPLSRRALLSYKYAIVDSMLVEGTMLYKIQYFPKRKRELTFEGSFWADTVKYVVHSIDLSASEGFNVNFVNSIYISQKYKKVNDKLYTLSQDSLAMDFSPFKQFKFIGAQASKVTSYYDQKVDVLIPISFAANLQVLNDQVYTLSDEKWKQIRPVALKVDDQDIYKMHDTLAKNSRFIAYKRLGEMISSGYYRIGNIDYGPYYNMIGYNEVEGLRLQFGARSYFSMNDKWRIGGYAAYGTSDKDAKYGIGFTALLSQKGRVIVSLGYRDDLEQRGVLLSQTNDVFSRNFASSLFTIGENNKLTNTVSYAAGIETEFLKNVRFKVNAKYESMTSIAGFDMAYLDEKTGLEQNNIKDFQMIYTLSFTPDRKEIGFGVDRDFVTNWHPTYRLSYTRGYSGVMNSAFDYEKVKLYYRLPFLTTFFGKTILTTEAGTTIGTVPLQLMDIIPGNQTISIQENMFGLMDYYEFVSDTYATLHLDHHFNGRLTNKIPLFNRLDLRTVAGFRAAWGEIRNSKNTFINRSEVIYQSPDKGYMEFSAGVENIFKVLRVDAVWRASYLNNVNASPFGVRFLLKIVF